MTRRDESGHATVLALGFALIAFAVAGLAVDGTRAFLFRRTLQNAADAAALAGASEIDRNAYYASGGRVVRLDERAAEDHAASLLRSRGVTSEAGIDVGERTVAVALRGNVDTTFLGLVGIGQIAVGAESVARPIAGDG